MTEHPLAGCRNCRDSLSTDVTALAVNKRQFAPWPQTTHALHRIAGRGVARPSQIQNQQSLTAVLAQAAALAGNSPSPQEIGMKESEMKETDMTTVTFTRTQPPEWLLAFWKEIDDKTFGKGFDCFAKDAICNLGVADWHGREAIRANLRAFIDTGFTAHHDVVEYRDGGPLKVFRGIVTMTPDDKSKPAVQPTMTHFFYMDKADPTKVSHWYGAVGPVGF